MNEYSAQYMIAALNIAHIMITDTMINPESIRMR